MSENGWTDDFLCEQWFRDIFIPHTKARNTSGAPILLIYDGHGSHLTDGMVQLAEENNVELFQLPPHTTHRMQPLDVGIFGPLQRRWMERCDDVLEETGEEIRKVDFIREYLAARALAFLPETIRNVWQKCGICPLNPKVFTDKDFAPSYSTSTRSSLPQSYPKQPGYLEGEEDPEEEEGDPEDEKDDDEDSSDTGSDDEMDDDVDREEDRSNHAGKSIRSSMFATPAY